MTPYYEDDHCTIYHGDCQEIDAWLAADVLVTDPPYGIHYKSERFGTANEPIIAGETATGRSSERRLTTEHVQVRDSALTMWGASRPGLVFGSWRAPRPTATIHRLVWDKSPIGQGGVGPWRVADEEIYLIGSAEHWGSKRSSQPHTSVLRINGYGNQHDKDRPNHPTPKPLGLMVHLISNAPPGAVADPFMGSGSTLRAAKDLGRNAIGVELEERYCEIAAKRLAQEVLAL